MNAPKILVYDIETAPIRAFVWKLWDNNVALNQIDGDWHLLSYSAKWFGKPKVFYKDQRKVKNIEDDSKLLRGIWKLLDEADIVLTQNGKKFDQKKVNARFILNGFNPPSPYRHIDTCEIARKHFGFTSNKLEYMTDKLCTRYKKLKHKKFPGFEMWSECLKGNLQAWKAMEKYNKYDVLALEELYTKMRAWDSSINFNVYSDNIINKCSCGNTNYHKHGFAYTNTAKYMRYQCTKCGKTIRGRDNLLSRDKRKSLKMRTS